LDLHPHPYSDEHLQVPVGHVQTGLDLHPHPYSDEHLQVPVGHVQTGLDLHLHPYSDEQLQVPGEQEHFTFSTLPLHLQDESVEEGVEEWEVTDGLVIVLVTVVVVIAPSSSRVVVVVVVVVQLVLEGFLVVEQFDVEVTFDGL
jgi:hypothetical protein